jgi:predicted oxidoreductase
MAYTIDYNGKSVTLPEFGNIPTGVLRKARHEKESDHSWFILEQTLSPKDLALIDSLPVSEFAKHMKAWTQGVSLGE